MGVSGGVRGVVALPLPAGISTFITAGGDPGLTPAGALEEKGCACSGGGHRGCALDRD